MITKVSFFTSALAATTGAPQAREIRQGLADGIQAMFSSEGHCPLVLG
jgi:hypothetical protein